LLDVSVLSNITEHRTHTEEIGCESLLVTTWTLTSEYLHFRDDKLLHLRCFVDIHLFLFKFH